MTNELRGVKNGRRRELSKYGVFVNLGWLLPEAWLGITPHDLLGVERPR